MIDMFKTFMEDKDAWDMYVTGRAGTGKTTGMRQAVQHLIDNEVPYVVCAFTHKACDILREKLPDGAIVMTLHKFLKKRPSVNTHATKKEHVSTNKSFGEVQAPKVVLIDEYSMVGEKDLMDVRALQDEDYDGHPELKAVWFGDPFQLPPVGDQQSVKPEGAYQCTLTKVWRQDNDNPLRDTIDKVVSYIEGAPAEPLTPHDTFTRGLDLVEAYTSCGSDDKVLLAYTNWRVQELNAAVQGRTSVEYGDRLHSPTTKRNYVFTGNYHAADVESVITPFSGELVKNTKYRTLEHLLQMEGLAFYELQDEEMSDETGIMAVVFGHGTYRDKLIELKEAAAASNAAIQKQHRANAAVWSKANAKHPLARQRAKAWRDYLTFQDCVICVDFPHAMTVHKSQGSTYEHVFLDTEDLGKAAAVSYEMYLRLTYVALSRASKDVSTN